MSERTIPDEWVETAARAYHEAAPEAVAGTWDVSTPLIHERGRVRARAALEAVAPLIAAAALRRAIDAADEAFAQEDVAMTQWGNGYIGGQGAALDFMRNYANEMEADRG